MLLLRTENKVCSYWVMCVCCCTKTLHVINVLHKQVTWNHFSWNLSFFLDSVTSLLAPCPKLSPCHNTKLTNMMDNCNQISSDADTYSRKSGLSSFQQHDERISPRDFKAAINLQHSSGGDSASKRSESFYCHSSWFYHRDKLIFACF